MAVFPRTQGSTYIFWANLTPFSPKYLVAYVTVENAATRALYFPAGAGWLDVLGNDPSRKIEGGQSRTVEAPLDTIPVYARE